MLAFDILLKVDILLFFLKKIYIYINNGFFKVHLYFIGKRSVRVEFEIEEKRKKYSRNYKIYWSGRNRPPSYPRATSQKHAVHEKILFFLNKKKDLSYCFFLLVFSETEKKTKVLYFMIQLNLYHLHSTIK